jgi:hypothetical protein
MTIWTRHRSTSPTVSTVPGAAPPPEPATSATVPGRTAPSPQVASAQASPVQQRQARTQALAGGATLQQTLHAKAATSTPSAAPTTDAARVIAGFKQGGAGNCVSIAAMKAAMVAFGPDHVFRSVSRGATGTDITMRDGVTVTVSDAELREAARHSRLTGPDQPLVESATLMYAAMAKRAMAEGNDGRRHRTFASACNSLNNGESYLEGAHWLGIEQHMKEIPASEIKDHVAVVAASNKHAVFSSNGTIDRFGTVQQTGTDGFGRTLHSAYAIIPDATSTPAPTPTPTPTPSPEPTPPPAPSPEPTHGSGSTLPGSGGTQVSGAQIIAGFKQGGTGNCVSVAAIKAAMTAFGPDQIFRSVSRTPTGHDVVMRDGVSVHVTDAELARSRSLSRFEGADRALLDQANLAFAAMSKRVILEGNDGYRQTSLDSAARSLNNGESFLEGAHWLGLDGHMKTIAPGEIHQHKAVVAASKKHAVFVTDGVVDRFGQARNTPTDDGFGRSLRWAYAIVPELQPQA